LDHRRNLSVEYRDLTETAPGVEPWAELESFRNNLAHALPGDLVSRRIWFESREDLDRIRIHFLSLR
jgi:uncharacterized protein with HEPN domain